MQSFSIISKIHEGLSQKAYSCKELTQSYLDAIAKENGALNAYTLPTPEKALESARKVDEKLARGETLRPLEGSRSRSRRTSARKAS